MGKKKTNEPRFDSNGARMVMRKRDLLIWEASFHWALWQTW